MAASVAELLNWAVPEAVKCVEQAEALRAEHTQLSPEAVAQRAVAQARNWAAAAGGATGAVANPLIMLPAAMADMGAVLRIEGIMAGTIGALLEPESLKDEQTFRADVLTIVFPGAVSQALRQIGVRAGQRVTQQLVRKYLAEGLLESFSKLAARRLFLHVSERAIISKTVPLIGAGIGAGWNWLELHAVGQRAIRYYQHKTIGPVPQPERFQRVRSLVKMLPWMKREGIRNDEGRNPNDESMSK